MKTNLTDWLICPPHPNICYAILCDATYLQSLGCTNVCRLLFILFEVDTEMERKLGLASWVILKWKSKTHSIKLEISSMIWKCFCLSLTLYQQQHIQPFSLCIDLSIQQGSHLFVYNFVCQIWIRHWHIYWVASYLSLDWKIVSLKEYSL